MIIVQLSGFAYIITPLPSPDDTKLQGRRGITSTPVYDPYHTVYCHHDFCNDIVTMPDPPTTTEGASVAPLDEGDDFVLVKSHDEAGMENERSPNEESQVARDGGDQDIVRSEEESSIAASQQLDPLTDELNAACGVRSECGTFALCLIFYIFI